MRRVQIITAVGLILCCLTGCAIGDQSAYHAETGKKAVSESAVETAETVDVTEVDKNVQQTEIPKGEGIHVTILESKGNMSYNSGDPGKLASVCHIFEDIGYELFFDGDSTTNIVTDGFRNYGADEGYLQQWRFEKETISDVKEAVKKSDYVFLLGCQQYQSDFSDLEEIIGAAKETTTIYALGYEGIFGDAQYSEDYLKNHNRIIYVDMKRIMKKMEKKGMIDPEIMLEPKWDTGMAMTVDSGFFYALAAHYCIGSQQIECDFEELVSEYNMGSRYQKLTGEEVRKMSATLMPFVKEELMFSEASDE